MKHLKKKRELGRVRKQRTALLRTLLGSLVMHKKIKTTEAKAKEIKGKVDKLITKAKKSQKGEQRLAVIRGLNKVLPRLAVKEIISEEFLKKMSVRESGYTKIIKLDRRKSDGAKMAIIEIVS